MAKFHIDDGYSSFLVEGASFVGKYQIPELMRQEPSIPKALIPFDKRKKYDGKDIAVDFYMHDMTFRQVISHADRYVDVCKRQKERRNSKPASFLRKYIPGKEAFRLWTKPRRNCTSRYFRR